MHKYGSPLIQEHGGSNRCKADAYYSLSLKQSPFLKERRGLACCIVKSQPMEGRGIQRTLFLSAGNSCIYIV
ncbi:hypothetical protein XELAEV_18030065mg [Xenopus laevis]|uniref:Uncharacterized protein n=1 Tax=Xenopus laevis TaxID=8355 RepID=A0A974CSV5_XENLA|nr:hypothetical protein XELAEV_18030065mg [Xenopus laevis]